MDQSQGVGQEHMTNKWTQSDIGDQRGRIFVVTGANTGLGKETARHLLRQGAQVVLACRNEDKARQAQAEFKEQQLPGRAEVLLVDLAKLSSVDQFADSFAARYEQIDVLINNAGVMMPPYSKTTDGFELQLGINHLGHFALTARLLPLLKRGRNPRVVSVSSMAHRTGFMDFEDLHYRQRPYKKMESYSQSKLANLLFHYELQRRLTEAKSSIKAVAAHPGWSSTDLGRHLRGMSVVDKLFGPFLGMPAEKGALPLVRAAVDPTTEGGEYFGPHQLGGMKGWPQLEEPKPQATNHQDAQRLWQISEELTGVSFAF